MVLSGRTKLSYEKEKKEELLKRENNKEIIEPKPQIVLETLQEQT